MKIKKIVEGMGWLARNLPRALSFRFAAKALSSCELLANGNPHPLHLVYLVDVIASIKPRALKDAFHAIRIEAARLQRGDRISVIPITGDAENDAQGRILRMRVPEKRQPYDQDLVQFKRKFDAALESFERRALAHPYDHTDILGSIVLAAQEFAMDPPRVRGKLIIFSDFIEEGGRFNFMTDPRLASTERARVFANSAGKKIPNFRGVSIFLGQLRSTELGSMPQARSMAIQTFWLNYLINEGAHDPEFVLDGPGLSYSDFR